MVALLACAGCRSGEAVHSAHRIEAAAKSGVGLEVAGVSFLTVEPGRMRGMAEVVFRNGGAEPVAFTDVLLGGRPLVGDEVERRGKAIDIPPRNRA